MEMVLRKNGSRQTDAGKPAGCRMQRRVAKKFF